MLDAEDAVVVEETGGGAFQVRVQTGEHSFLMDEPLSYGGLSSGPSPFDMLAAALGACTVMTLKLYASRKNWEVGPFKVRVSHRKDTPDARDTFQRIIELGDVTQEQQERLLYIAQRCPVHLLFERGADVATEVAQTALPPAETAGLHEQVIEELCREAK